MPSDLSPGFNPHLIWDTLLRNVQTDSQIARKLIQDAYDAFAKEICIYFYKNYILIQNDSDISRYTNPDSEDASDCRRDVSDDWKSFPDLRSDLPK